MVAETERVGVTEGDMLGDPVMLGGREADPDVEGVTLDVGDTLLLCVDVSDGDRDPEGEADPLSDTLEVKDRVGDAVMEGGSLPDNRVDEEGLTLGVRDLVRLLDRVREGLWELLSVPEGDAVAVVVRVLDDVPVTVGVMLGVTDMVPVVDGVTLMVPVRDGVRDRVGEEEGVGLRVAVFVYPVQAPYRGWHPVPQYAAPASQ